MGLAGEVKSPSFLAISPSRKYLYSVSEAPMGAASPGKPATGGVSSFSIDQKTGKLTLLNQESSGGSGPCHVSVDHTGKTLLVANYGSGHVASLPVKDDAPWPPRPRCTSMSRLQGEPEASGRAPRPLHQRGCWEPICLCRRSGLRPRLHLQTGCRPRQDHPQHTRIRHRPRWRGAAPLCLPPQRQVRVCLQ